MAPADLASLVAALRVEIGDEDGNLLADSALERCLAKAVFRLSRDLESPLSLEGGTVVPEPSDETRELILLLALINACQLMRARTANAFSFSSGDKRVDKSDQSSRWAKLEEDLEASYRQRLDQVRPGATTTDGSILRPRDFAAYPYEQGSELL